MRHLILASAVLIALAGCNLESGANALLDKLKSNDADTAQAEAVATDAAGSDDRTSDAPATAGGADPDSIAGWPDAGLDAASAPADGAATMDAGAAPDWPDTGIAAGPEADVNPAPAGFDVSRVPESTATLPPLPFFDLPPGNRHGFDEKQRRPGFDERYVLAGDALMRIEGEVYQDRFNLTRGTEAWSKLQFLRNYGNVIQGLGGHKVSTVDRVTNEMWQAAGNPGLSDKHKSFSEAVNMHGPRMETWLIRQGGKEYWINLSAWDYGPSGFYTVIERTGMTQSLGMLDASQMLQALDADGRVALYINFDVDRADLRGDALPLVAEIETLLRDNPGLSLSVEGHTDNTGGAAHNRDLSKRRAEAVVGALVARGIDAGRLQSAGFGPDRPLAGNESEDGRARNRRVELVKRN